jgi:hypothetical protein
VEIKKLAAKKVKSKKEKKKEKRKRKRKKNNNNNNNKVITNEQRVLGYGFCKGVGSRISQCKKKPKAYVYHLYLYSIY